MPEGKSYFIYPKQQEKHFQKIDAFFKENGVCFSESRELTDELIELSFGGLVSISPEKAFNFLRKVSRPEDWYRLFEIDEYGTEILWYIDSQSSWRVASSQEEPNLTTLRVYRYWHKGMDSISYGALTAEDLYELEKLYGAVDTTKPFDIFKKDSFEEQVGGKLDFLGKGVLVPYAPESWDWYILDHECLAMETARHCDFPPVDGCIRFRRTFMIDGDAGYLWSWRAEEAEIFLVFNFFGQHSCNKKMIKNTDGLSIDELILLAYFYRDFEEGFEKLDAWFLVSDPEKDRFYPESLESIDESPFAMRSYFNCFGDRVISTNRGLLIRSIPGEYYLAEFQGAEREESYILINDPSLDGRIRHYMPHLYEALAKGLYCEIKIRMKSRHEISELLGCRFVEDIGRGRTKTLGEIPVRLDYVRHL